MEEICVFTLSYAFWKSVSEATIMFNAVTNFPNGVGYAAMVMLDYEEC